MREIKFRGKRLDNGEWVYGDLIHFTKEFDNVGTYTRYCITYTRYCIKEYDTGFEYEIDPETVGQDTGLKDKNGKEIYEGDIVKYSNNSYNNLIAAVEQKEARYGIWDKTLEENKDKYCFVFNCICMYLGEMEVIGNIHDNPELKGE